MPGIFKLTLEAFGFGLRPPMLRGALPLAAPLPEFRIGYVEDPRSDNAAVAATRTALAEILATR